MMFYFFSVSIQLNQIAHSVEKLIESQIDNRVAYFSSSKLSVKIRSESMRSTNAKILLHIARNQQSYSLTTSSTSFV